MDQLGNQLDSVRLGLVLAAQVAADGPVARCYTAHRAEDWCGATLVILMVTRLLLDFVDFDWD